MGRCSIIGCRSDNETKVPDLSFHSFPEDMNIRRQWIEATGRTNWVPKKYSKICSKHFAKDLLVKKKKLTQLFPGSVPTLEIKSSISSILLQDTTSTSFTSSTSVASSIMVTKSGSEHGIAQQPATSDQEYMEIDYNLPSTSSAFNLSTGPSKSDDSPNYTPRTLKKKWKKSQIQSKERLKKLRALREKSRRLTKKLANLENIIAELKAKCMVSEEEGEILDSIDPINRDFLKKYLNPAASTRKYSPPLRKFALCLHFISPRAYKYVRQQFNTCLPHPSTLTAWYKSVDANPGFTTESLECIKLLAKRKSLYCALIMDEMVIRKHIQWNGTQCVGLVNYGEALDGHNVTEAKEALVFLVNCINGSWKIPVGYFLTNGCSGDQKAMLVRQCLKVLTVDCGINVASLTFDGCPANFAMAKNLGCRIDGRAEMTPFFAAENKRIVIIPDPAHMLKLVRNTLGQKIELIDSQGGLISWRFIENLNSLQEDEGLHLANRLRTQHINFTKQIMKVKLAAQTFSNSVADAIELCNKKLNLSEVVLWFRGYC